MKLIKGDESGSFYINMDMIESIKNTYDGKYKVLMTGTTLPYYISKEAFDSILNYDINEQTRS